MLLGVAAPRSKLLCVAFSTALAGGLHALAADLHELQTTLALFFGDVPFGAPFELVVGTDLFYAREAMGLLVLC